MESRLLEFIHTLDLSLRTLQKEAGESPDLAKLTINQFRYLEAIHELGRPTVTEVAQRLEITKASVTEGIYKLIRQGYVVKTQSSDDRRVFHLYLTETGKGLMQAKYQALKEYEQFIAAALDEEETRMFEAILEKLVRLFHQGKFN